MEEFADGLLSAAYSMNGQSTDEELHRVYATRAIMAAYFVSLLLHYPTLISLAEEQFDNVLMAQF